jgi:outer membrane protein assembly factor BamB
MSSTRSAWRTFFRVWFPLIVIVLAAGSIAVAWNLPYENMTRMILTLTVWVAGMLSVLLLSVWLVFLSGLRWYVGLASIVLIGLVFYALVREVKYDGDMVPARVYLRWQPTPDDRAKQERAKQDASKLPPIDLTVTATDMPAFRGVNRDGVVQGPTLNRDWDKVKPKELWKMSGFGGYGAFAVAGNVAITLEQRYDKEAIACYDTATGVQRWVYEYPALFKDFQGGDGPRATPTIYKDVVFSLGAKGDLVCLDARDGAKKWATNILEGNDNIQWGMSGSPLVDESNRCVYVCPGAQKEGAPNAGAIVAYSMEDGRVLAKGGSHHASYSSPQFATLAGQPQILIFDANGVAGYTIGDLKELWRFEWKVSNEINVAQPLVFPGDRVFITTDYFKGCVMLQVIKDDKGTWSAKEAWKPNQNMQCKFTSPVALGDYIFGLDDGKLVCVDAKDGKKKWRGTRYGHGQILRQDDLILVLSEQGDLALVEATPDEFRELTSMHVLDAEKTWNTPALVNGIAYVRNHEQMACYDLRAKTGP